ncbi:MAG: gamma-glutamyl-gamma-aminobutyrate hydrolase family protein [Clostridiales bacterium]|nr:gamma-glutamyl-gamma-aminobutyrate hydrolase family protein [Clostridiales bacterium]
MKPIIGITCDYDYESKTSKLHENYFKAISKFDGLPILLPGNNIEDIEIILSIVDGILLTGGADIDPFYYDENPHIALGNINPYRDEFEIELAKQTIDRNIPILGICRGAQVMNVAMGGSLYQDIEACFKDSAIAHRQKAPTDHGTHTVQVDPGSLLYKIVENEKISVNSFHHQAVKRVAPGFKAIGHAPDNVVEAITNEDHAFALGLQWHPERMIDSEKHSKYIFNAFIDAAINKRK